MPFVRAGTELVWFEAGAAAALHKAANMYAQRPGAYPLSRPLRGTNDAERLAGVVRAEGGEPAWHTCGPGALPADRGFVFSGDDFRGVLLRRGGRWLLLRPGGVAAVEPEQALRGGRLMWGSGLLNVY